MTSNPDFKVTILFNVNKNCTRYSYIYNGGPIESRIRSIELAPFSITLTPNPRVRIRVRVMVRVRVRVGKVRKPYPNFQMVPLSMTLSEL